jgi:hypothetical protein
VSPAAFAASMRAVIRAEAAALEQRTGSASTRAFNSPTAHGSAVGSTSPPIAVTRLAT